MEKRPTNRGPAYMAGYITVLQESIGYTLAAGIPEDPGCYIPEASGMMIQEVKHDAD